MFKLNAKVDADLSLYSFSQFECDAHTVHMLTQWHLLSSLTGTVKSLAASLHQCHGNRSCYINNGGTFSRQISYNL